VLAAEGAPAARREREVAPDREGLRTMGATDLPLDLTGGSIDLVDGVEMAVGQDDAVTRPLHRVPVERVVRVGEGSARVLELRLPPGAGGLVD
jgi:hypothetical protein